jgi:hypothetical protein
LLSTAIKIIFLSIEFSLQQDFFSIQRITGNVSHMVDLGSGSIDLMFFWSKQDLIDKILWVDQMVQSGRFKDRPVAYITGLGHHYKGEGYFHTMIPQLTNFYRQRIQGTLNRFFWVPLPGNSIRNRYMRDWDEFGDVYVLPLDKIARSGVFGMNLEYGREGIHFQCAFTDNGEGIMFYYQLRLRQYKSPRSGDCRDLPNLNTIMIILNILSENAGKVY